jgi:hypothetical protein
MIYSRLIILTALASLFVVFSYGQEGQSEKEILQNLSASTLSKYLDATSDKANKLKKKLSENSLRTLRQMQKEEEKLRRKLFKKDSLTSNRLFASSERKYAEWREKIASASKISSQTGLNYIPYLDTLKTTLNFISHNTDKIKNQSEDLKERLNNTINTVSGLDNKLDQAQAVRQFLKERRQYLKEQLSKFGLANRMKKMNKQVYYYSQAIQEYKNDLKDPKKIEARTIGMLRKIPAFKKFMESNSEIASLFGIPTTTTNSGQVSFTGLQTRATVQQLVQNSVGTGSNSQKFLTTQLQSASQQMAANKNSLILPEIQDNMGEMPDFKPNQQKTKSFLKRIEYGANIQFGKTNRFLPTSSELAFSIGYKLNDKAVLGIGSSYKLGLGTGINHIRFSHQGFGLRSYLDWKMKGSIYLAGGYEKNYLPQLNDISQLMESWQESGLIGISKKYPAGKKRKGYVQVLFDFLSYKNIPRSQPVLFRTGINF